MKNDKRMSALKQFQESDSIMVREIANSLIFLLRTIRDDGVYKGKPSNEEKLLVTQDAIDDITKTLRGCRKNETYYFREDLPERRVEILTTLGSGNNVIAKIANRLRCLYLCITEDANKYPTENKLLNIQDTIDEIIEILMNNGSDICQLTIGTSRTQEEISQCLENLTYKEGLSDKEREILHMFYFKWMGIDSQDSVDEGTLYDFNQIIDILTA